MADEIVLSNLADDSEIKKYVNNVLMPAVFKDIPLNNLNTGFIGIVNENMSQVIEQLAYTSSFYFNESFITKALLPESIYSEAAIFNIGYSFATPSNCGFLLELKIEDIVNNAKINSNTGLYEFILDKDTKFNLKNGNVYSLDYDILIQFKNIKTGLSSTPAWNIQYTNTDEINMCAKNTQTYITYRVTDTWLCLYVQASEYSRTKYVVVNNMMNGIPNPDKVITCLDHIAGFDVTYIDGSGNRTQITHDHLLPIHADVKDGEPYIHYKMDSPNAIRFMFQLNGNRYFVPATNSSYEITIYSCHGSSANFTAYDNLEQPSVITATNKYSNNANVLKAAFVASASAGGSDIGSTETVRRETIQAYNTANVVSSDHDIEEWFKTFYFKNILYPFFFKRRDDPWGRIWSGFIALKDDDDYVFRTNTVHCNIPYNVLYNNNDNTMNGNEIIIPPGWLWTYTNLNRYTVTPYTMENSNIVEKASTLTNIKEKFVFTNPFGIRIQKDPFAIGYFNPWINESFTLTHLTRPSLTDDDIVSIYHATPLIANIKRSYKENYYKISTYISPTIQSWKGNSVSIHSSELVKYAAERANTPTFSSNMWTYFREPVDVYAKAIPLLRLQEKNGFIPFEPSTTYLCVKNRDMAADGTWTLSDVWIEDNSKMDDPTVLIPITGEVSRLYGTDSVWGENGLWNGYEVYVSGKTDINISPSIDASKNISFNRESGMNYYRLELTDRARTGQIVKIVVSKAAVTSLTKFGETHLVKIGDSYADAVVVNVYFDDSTVVHYSILNAANVYIPYEFSRDSSGQYVFEMDNVGARGIILYAEMKPEPDSGAVDYYRIPFGLFNDNDPMMYVETKVLPLEKNNMRVVLHALMNGSETGYVEMQPVARESDGSYKYEVVLYPLNQLVDVDNRINIASVEYGGGSWIANDTGKVVSIDATNPELRVSILIRSEHDDRDSEFTIGDTFTGFAIVDQYMLDDVSLVQELKEMRSVVNFGETSIPTEDQIDLYNEFISLMKYDESSNGNFYTIYEYARRKKLDMLTERSLADIKLVCQSLAPVYEKLEKEYYKMFSITEGTDTYLERYDEIIRKTIPNAINDEYVNWSAVYNILNGYIDHINNIFEPANVNGGMEVQLVPMVEYSLMNNDRFESFIHAFTSVHKAIEPVIFTKLEGNNYLDCKLLATYGLPHAYTPDIDTTAYWPSLSVQIEFDCHLRNNALATNTINELKIMIKSYFNRLTSVHNPLEMVDMNNNIYISHVIKQMESHDNVTFCRFKGWYTSEKNSPNGSYLDANCQGIIQKYDSIDSFPQGELESYVPELYVLDDDDILINLV